MDYIDGSSTDVALNRIDISTHWLGQKSQLHDTSNQTMSADAIEVNDLSLAFKLQGAILKRNRRMLQAVDNISFSIAQSESFGLVGESGSGKSTVARLIAGLHKPDSGTIQIVGQNVLGNQKDPLIKAARRNLQMIFQDPYSSLNGRLRVLDIVAEPIRFYQQSDNEKHTRQLVRDLLEHVGLGAGAAHRYPHEFSGGQRQRISIARALASRPRILICDEPTSALDVSIQAQILNLLKDLQDELGLTLLFISHDLPVIRQMCDRVAVMRDGAICEIALTEDLFSNPKHEYSQHLLELMPRMDVIGV